MSKHCLNVILYSNAESLMAAILSLAAAGKHETRQKKAGKHFLLDSFNFNTRHKDAAGLS